MACAGMEFVMYQVLLIDDDREVLHMNQIFLRKKGYAVQAVVSIEEALANISRQKPDCIVMDVMMPRIDGFTGFEKLRRRTDAPILFLTGRTSETDRIRGLRLGADDYIVKPCSLEELSLRIQINIRRQQKTAARTGILEFSPLAINLFAHQVFYDGQELLLSNKEYDLLVCLAKHVGKVMTYEQIGKELAGGYIEADRKNIMVTASRLRKKLEGCVGLEHMIETVWGRGYCFRGTTVR